MLSVVKEERFSDSCAEEEEVKNSMQTLKVDKETGMENEEFKDEHSFPGKLTRFDFVAELQKFSSQHVMALRQGQDNGQQ